MMTNNINLKTSFNIRHLSEINCSNPREIMQKFLIQGYQQFILSGSPLDKFTSHISLYIENDIEFIIESYFYLEELVIDKETFTHNTFLGDGILEIQAVVDKEIVDVNYNYYPGLNIANFINYHEKTTKEKYLAWWRNLAHDITILVEK